MHKAIGCIPRTKEKKEKERNRKERNRKEGEEGKEEEEGVEVCVRGFRVVGGQRENEVRRRGV